MAYQRITLTQLKTRLEERLGGEQRFWTEPEREHAINEAIAAWQLLTGEVVVTDTQTLPANTNLLQLSLDKPVLTTLRIRCDDCGAGVVTAVDTDSPASGEAITFTSTVTCATAPITYLWDFGDTLPAVNTTDLYGYWPLNEGWGNSRVCTIGAGPDLLEVGGTVADTTGRFNKAVSSTEADTSALEAAITPPLAVAAGLTVAIWFKWPTAPAVYPHSLFALDNGGSGAGIVAPALSVARYYTSDFLEVIFSWGASPNYIVLPNPRLGDFVVNTWHLLVISYDAGTGLMTGRVDDGCMESATVWTAVPLPAEKLEALVPPASLTVANASTFTRVQLTRAFSGSHRNFAGALDDLRIWNRVLTDAQIADLWYRSDEETPTYSYGEASTETTTLTITDAVGCTATDTVSVTVSAPPIDDLDISVTAVPDWENGADGEMMVQFTYTVTGGTAPLTYSLSWTGGGDGGPNTAESPLITFLGTPLADETIPWSVTVIDANLYSATDSGTVDVTYQD